MVIDDTYNASPVSVLAALNLLEDIVNDTHRAVAVLGDMLELGAYEEAGHRLVGGRAAQVAAKLVTVGARARWIADEALAAGMKSTDVHPAANNDDAIAVLLGLLGTGDIVLVKGSRVLAMESIVDALAETAESKS
jgi:UDP-N-acetylmuramoyl-tripeptide--D-alanyl-D-alanine ligase